MRIPESTYKCVVFIGYRLVTGDFSPQGTGFFVARRIGETEKINVFLVTAKHVIQGIESKEFFDGKIVIRANLGNGTATSLEVDVDEWIFHPEESEVDVAVLPFLDLPQDIDATALHTDLFIRNGRKDHLEVELGDEVFFTGMFYNHRGRARNIPIARFGHIASGTEEKVKIDDVGFIDAYLIDAHSVGGLSGGPVFVNFGIFRIENGRPKYSSEERGKVFLLGLMHGHFKADIKIEGLSGIDAKRLELVNFGISIVVPSDKILEVMDHPMILKREKEIEAENGMLAVSVPDTASDSDNEVFTENLFTDALKKASRTTSEPASGKKETSE